MRIVCKPECANPLNLKPTPLVLALFRINRAGAAAAGTFTNFADMIGT